MANLSISQSSFRSSSIQAVATVLAIHHKKDLIVQLFQRVKQAGYLSDVKILPHL